MSERNPSAGEFVLPKSVLYVKREADDLLYDLTVDGRYPYVVGLPETGKSSLVMQTALRLRSASVQTSVVDVADVARIAGSGEASPFYRSIARQIHRDLGIEFDLEAWWQERTGYSGLLVLNEFFRQVSIRARSAVAVFLDGIDFIPREIADDLLPGIRYCFNARATDAEFRKLTFVLTGVAAPFDLISAQLTPYNIGTRIDLSDFTPEEAHQLGRRLNAQQMIRAMFWTGGHPYFTQVVCAGATEGADVDDIVEQRLLSSGAREDMSIESVRDRLKRADVAVRWLRRQIKNGVNLSQAPNDQRRALLQTGVVRIDEDRRLRVRNRVYEQMLSRL